MAAVTHGMLDPGNVIVSSPYFIGGRSGVSAAFAAGADVFSLRNLGRLDVLGGGPIIGAPLRISKIRLGFAAVTAYTAGGFGIEAHKVTGFTVQATGGTTVQAVNRKTTGYQAVASAEVDAMIANAAALTPGTYTVVGGGSTPIAFAAGGSGSTFPCFTEDWSTSDLCPLTLEQGEGLIVRNTVAQAAGTGVLFVQIDFLRQ